MSYAVDVNILLYASDRNSSLHPRALEFLAECSSRSEAFCLAWPTVMGYLRIATHPSVFSAPLSVEQAAANVEALLAWPHTKLLSEGEGFWSSYRQVTRQGDVKGNLVPDAHLATLLLQHGVRVLYSNDSDFRRFGFLDLRNPFG